MDTNLKFELLVLDTGKQSVIQSELNLLNSLLSNGLLWKTPSLDDNNMRITDGGITLETKRVKADPENEAEPSKAFFVKVAGNYDWLEPKRKLIVEFLKKQNFDYLYVLLDQVSKIKNFKKSGRSLRKSDIR